jgi:hypothetical protein
MDGMVIVLISVSNDALGANQFIVVFTIECKFVLWVLFAIIHLFGHLLLGLKELRIFNQLSHFFNVYHKMEFAFVLSGWV